MSHFSPILRKKLWRGQLAFWTAMLVVCLLPSLAWTQQAGFPSIYYPSTPGKKQWQVSVGLTQITPPKELTEEARVRAPAFDLHALYGLSPEFALDGRAISQVIQNHFSVGGRWAHSMGNFSFGVGYDVAYWFGFLEVASFDSKAHGWFNYPSITVGYNLGDVRLIGKGEAWLDLYHKTSVGDNEVETDQNKLVGGSFTLAMEQAFWKNTQLTLGFRATYTKFHWMTWQLFSTLDKYLFYPEIIIGFIL